MYFLNDATLPKICLLFVVHVLENHSSHVPVSMIEKITMHLLLYPTLNFQNRFSSQIDYWY